MINVLERKGMGYTILVLDKYILCGTSRNSYFKDINKLGNNMVRQYKSIKVLMNNVPSHLSSCYGPEFHEFNPVLNEALIKGGFINKSPYFYDEYVDYYKDGAIQYLLDKKLIRIVKINQQLHFENLK